MRRHHIGIRNQDEPVYFYKKVRLLGYKIFSWFSDDAYMQLCWCNSEPKAKTIVKALNLQKTDKERDSEEKN